jgi:hypothetical protein
MSGGGSATAVVVGGIGTSGTCSRAPLWSSAADVSSYLGPWLTVMNGVIDIALGNSGMDAYDAAGSLNCSISGTFKTCTPLWNHAIGFAGGG